MRERRKKGFVNRVRRIFCSALGRFADFLNDGLR
jgi:hypothetical protein